MYRSFNIRNNRKLVITLTLLALVELIAVYWVINASTYQILALITAIFAWLMISIIAVIKKAFYGIFFSLWPILVAAPAAFTGVGIIFNIAYVINGILLIFSIIINGKQNSST